MNVSGTEYGTRSGTRRERETETEPIAEAEAEKNLTSSLSAPQSGRRAAETMVSRIRAIDELDALTRVILALRPSWPPKDVRLALERDDRALTVIASAAVLGAADPAIAHPNGLRYVGPGYGGSATPTPMSIDDWRAAERCPNGAIHDPHPCALCRNGATA